MATPPLTRRRFLDLLLAGEFLAIAAAVLYPITSYLFPPVADLTPVEVNAGKASDLAPGTGRLVKMGPKPILVLRTADGEVRALSATCTHLNCTVQLRLESGDILCACHNGRYDLAGRNISGPPPRPLTTLPVEVREGDLYVKKA
jgi:Rieske Fe-S protein